MKSLMENYQLWQKPLQNICGKGADRNVKTFMVTPSEGEFVDEAPPWTKPFTNL